jgi:hypothetical protein
MIATTRRLVDVAAVTSTTQAAADLTLFSDVRAYRKRLRYEGLSVKRLSCGVPLITHRKG